MPFLRIFLMLMFFCSSTIFSQDEIVDWKAIQHLENAATQIPALEAFVTNYPQSSRKVQALSQLFRAYLEAGQAEAAISTSQRYLSAMPENRRGAAYNGLAWRLAEYGVGLELAREFAQKAVDWARPLGNERRLRSILDTQGFVLYRLGEYEQAERVQREAVVGNEDDPDYIGRLAILEEKNGKRRQALGTVTRTILYGGGEEYVEYLNQWTLAEAGSPEAAEILKTQVVRETLQAYLNGDQPNRNNAILLFVRTGVDLPKAEQWARDEVAKLSPETPAKSAISTRATLAKVLFTQKRFDDALEIAEPLAPFMTPWQDDYWYMLGQCYQAKGEHHKAMESYMSGMLVRRSERLSKALQTLYAREHGSVEGLEEALRGFARSLESFRPGKYAGQPKTARVILAEMFTGAECPPCVGATYAFQALGSYYPRTSVAILKYHLHIPGPDPMSNSSTYDRYDFYGKNFGTPTVFINGTDKMTGGGPRIVSKSNFYLYKQAIDAALPRKTTLQLTGQADLRRDRVTVTLALAGGELLHGPVNLNLALVERSVEYEGSNGIGHHEFVVRSLSDGGAGSPVNLTGEAATLKRTFDLKRVETELSAYLDAYQQKYANRFRGSNGWRARPEKLDRSNLAVVAWLQNPESREVYQAVYIDVPAPSATR